MSQSVSWEDSASWGLIHGRESKTKSLPKSQSASNGLVRVPGPATLAKYPSDSETDAKKPPRLSLRDSGDPEVPSPDEGVTALSFPTRNRGTAFFAIGAYILKNAMECAHTDLNKPLPDPSKAPPGLVLSRVPIGTAKISGRQAYELGCIVDHPPGPDAIHVRASIET